MTKLNFTGTDLCAINGTHALPGAHYQLVVIGAGSSGIAAAIAGAKDGLSVLLVDENPVSGAAMGNDVPLWFGGRMTAATQGSNRMLEAIFLSMPALETAIEAGVTVLLGTSTWGVYRNGPGVASLPEKLVGLADGERSWLVGFDRLVLATGARDLALAFPGWNQPGVMGAAALRMLLTRYDAFSGHRLLVLGSHDLALETALLAHEHGLEVAGLVEVRATPQGSAELLARIAGTGIPIHCDSAIVATKTGINGVAGATLTSGGTIDCDTICVAVGLVPAIELVDAMHGARHLDPLRGGYIPDGEDTIRAVGNCAGLADTGFDHIAYRMAWTHALAQVCADDTVICQCEEVTRADLLGVQPPNYLARTAPLCTRSLHTLLADGPANQDQIKRLTRAGMGVCQGRRCRDQVAMLLAMEAGQPFGTIPLASHRAPVRPLPLNIIADWAESPAMAAAWDVWFGIPTQWTPDRDIGTQHEQDQYGVFFTGMYE